MIKGKVAFVTGAGLGMGRGIAGALARQGASIAVADIDLPKAEESAAEIRNNGGEAMAVKVDVSNAASVKAAVEATVAKYGRLDIMVNNAGILSRVPTIDLTEEQWLRVLGVNLNGVLFCGQAAARVMVPQGGGRIINIASTAAHTAAAESAPYCVSKSGVMALTRVMAVEWAKHNILVNSISPGTFPTEMVKAARQRDPEKYARRDKRVPIQRAAEINDIANAVLFFADEGSSFVTGQDLLVDGGILCLDPGAVE